MIKNSKTDELVDLIVYHLQQKSFEIVSNGIITNVNDAQLIILIKPNVKIKIYFKDLWESVKIYRIGLIQEFGDQDQYFDHTTPIMFMPRQRNRINSAFDFAMIYIRSEIIVEQNKVLEKII